MVGTMFLIHCPLACHQQVINPFMWREDFLSVRSIVF